MNEISIDSIGAKKEALFIIEMLQEIVLTYTNSVVNSIDNAASTIEVPVIIDTAFKVNNL